MTNEHSTKSTVELLSESVCDRWQLVGEIPSVIGWQQLREEMGVDGCSVTGIATAIFVQEANTVECVVNQDTDWLEVQVGVLNLIARGWEVTVLAPLSALGSAHTKLSGSTANLQGWWGAEGGGVHFANHELA